MCKEDSHEQHLQLTCSKLVTIVMLLAFTIVTMQVQLPNTTVKDHK